MRQPFLPPPTDATKISLFVSNDTDFDNDDNNCDRGRKNKERGTEHRRTMKPKEKAQYVNDRKMKLPLTTLSTALIDCAVGCIPG